MIAPSYLSIEVYPVELKCFKNAESKKPTRLIVSKEDSLSKLIPINILNLFEMYYPNKNILIIELVVQNVETQSISRYCIKKDFSACDLSF